MPRKKQPLSFEALALKAVGEFIIAVGRNMVASLTSTNSGHGLDVLQQSITRLNEHLYSSVPRYLYDNVAAEVLTSVSRLISEIKCTLSKMENLTIFVNQMNVAVKLTEVALHHHLRQIDSSIWPKIMRHVLYKNLHALTGLEILNLGSGSGGWKTSDIEKSIIGAVVNMNNLLSLCLCFDCTDHILQIIGSNCKKLQCLDVTSSRSVTDRSVNSLLNCQELKVVLLYQTSVSVEGFAQLLCGLPKLETFGRCDEFGYILEYLHNNNSKVGPFDIRVFHSRDVSTYHLNLLIEMCPKVSHVSLYHDERISDLTVLSALDDLKELKLLSCDFFTDKIRDLLEVKGLNITWLHLEHVDEIDMNALMYISQFCPQIKRLVFYNCEFLEHTSLSLKKLTIPPFKCLESLLCIADCALAHLEFLLSNCDNIQTVQLGSSTGVGDDFMANVMSKNPMSKLEELKILYSDSLSMRTVNLLLSKCDNLRTLSELEGWQGITDQELINFREDVRRNNIDLDIRPTLSFSST